MGSEIPKWMLPEPAVFLPNRPEEASQTKTEDEAGREEEMEKCKRPRTTLDGEGGVEEFLVLLERIEEMKKKLKGKRTNFSSSSISAGGGINGAVEEGQMLMAMAGCMQQAQGSSDGVDTKIAYNNKKGARSTSPWKPSFRWEDFSKSNSTDSNGAAAAAYTEKKKKDQEGISIRIGNGLLHTRSFLDHGDAPAECSHVRVDYVKKNEEEVNAAPPPELELQLFPCM